MADPAIEPQEESQTVAAGSGESESLLKTIGTATTVTVAVLYGVGLLVTNAYLLSIGVLDFNLFRSRCVLTGAWATPVLFSMCLPTVLIIQTLSSEKDKKEGKASLIVAVCVLAAMFAWVAGMGFGLIPSIRMMLYYLAGVGLLLIPALGYAILYFTKKHDKRPNIKPGPPGSMLFYVLLLLCLIAICAGIGKYAYPSVFAGFGGGKPQRARLVLNHEGAGVWAKLPQSVDHNELAKKSGETAASTSADPVLTQEVEILYENESQLVVRWNLKESGSVVMLDRKLVAAIVPTERQL